MSAKNKHRTCAYCRKFKKSTVDHVPPKLLLEQPFPPNLLRYPAVPIAIRDLSWTTNTREP